MTSATDNRTAELVSRREATTLLEEFLCGYQNILLSRGINASEAVCKQNELIDEYAERIDQAIAATLGNGREIELGDALNEVAEKWAIAQVEAEDYAKRCMLLEELVRDLFDSGKYFNPERYGINVLAERARNLGIEVNL